MPASNINQDISWALRLGRSNGGTETFGSAVLRPVVNANYLVGSHSLADNAVDNVTAGDDGTPLIASDTEFTDAFTSLDNIDDVSLLAVPGRGSLQVVNEGMNYCANRSLSDCFFIGDMAPDDDDVPDAQAFAGTISPKNSYGAVYMPWLLGPDPTGISSANIPIPPSGYVAGIYAKTDANRGVWKAPAGIEAALAGASGLVANLTDAQHGDLNQDPYNVNVIRQFKNAGRVIWGARTISSDAEYRYVPVRRMAIMLRVSLYRGTQWVVFEPNDEPLWAQIRLNIGAFMHNLFRQGAFQGGSPKEAYLVKCDAETTTQNDINLGIVNIIVGFAPLKPAEFVMIKIQQLAGQVEA
jgi:phage tail sheath protein FI